MAQLTLFYFLTKNPQHLPRAVRMWNLKELFIDQKMNRTQDLIEFIMDHFIGCQKYLPSFTSNLLIFTREGSIVIILCVTINPFQGSDGKRVWIAGFFFLAHVSEAVPIQ